MTKLSWASGMATMWREGHRFDVYFGSWTAGLDDGFSVGGEGKEERGVMRKQSSVAPNLGLRQLGGCGPWLRQPSLMRSERQVEGRVGGWVRGEIRSSGRHQVDIVNRFLDTQTWNSEEKNG